MSKWPTKPRSAGPGFPKAKGKPSFELPRQRLLKRILFWLVEIPGTILVIVTLGKVWDDARPVAHPPKPLLKDVQPTAAVFTVENGGDFLPLERVKTACVIDAMAVEGYEQPVTAPGASQSAGADRMLPGDEREVDCLAGTVMKDPGFQQTGGRLTSMQVHLVVQYRTLMYSRTFTSDPYCWVPAKPAGYEWAACPANGAASG